MWLNRFNDAGRQLENIANYFGIYQVLARKKEMLQEYRRGLPLSSPEELNNSLIDFEKYALSLGITNIENDESTILALFEKLDIERRTINNQIYETQDAALIRKNEILKEYQRQRIEEINHGGATLYAMEKFGKILLFVIVFLLIIVNW